MLLERNAFLEATTWYHPGQLEHLPGDMTVCTVALHVLTVSTEARYRWR